MSGVYYHEFEKILTIRKKHKVIKPVKHEAIKFINELMQLLFPHFNDDTYYSPDEIEGKVLILKRNLKSILFSLNNNSMKEIELE